MTGGADLLGAAPEKRGRGRPKGSRNKRDGDLAAYLGVTAGGTTALQLAKFALVTPRQVREAGSVAGAYVAQAVDLSRRAREAGGDLTDDLVQLLLQAQRVIDGDGKKVDAALDRITARLLDLADPLPFEKAFAMLAGARADLLPYTDQKRPIAVDVTSDGAALPPPVALIMGSPGTVDPQSLAQQGFGDMVLPGEWSEVAPPKSHEDAEP